MSRHSTLTDPALHECKGAAAASTGTSPVKQADGSVLWQAPSAGAAGSVVKTQTTTSQTMLTGTTTIPFDNTIPQNTEGTEFITATITPATSGNKIRIEANIYGAYSVAATVTAALFQDSVANALAAVAVQTTTTNQNIVLRLSWEITTASASAHAFKIRIGGSTAGTFTLNGNAGAAIFGGVAASTLSLTEVKV